MRWDSKAPLDVFISYTPADERWATWIAGQLEAAGYRTLVQAWDFVPGNNFIDLMDRGVRDSAVVVAVLSRNYFKSHYGRMEWNAALRIDHTKLVPIRIDDCQPEGLLAPIIYLDLVDITDPDMARERLLTRLRHALEGRARPAREPSYPTLIEVLPSDADETLPLALPALPAEPAIGQQVPEPLRVRRRSCGRTSTTSRETRVTSVS